MTPAALARVVAHRGASGEAPENTLGAIRLAAEQGARCVEIDVSISRDDVPYVHHDATLERCTDGIGALVEHDAATLDSLLADQRWTRSNDAPREPLPRLEAVVELCIEHELGLNLEIKPVGGLERRTARAICPLIERRWPSALPFVFSSFVPAALDATRERLPEAARALLVGTVPKDWRARLERHGCRNLHCAGTRLTPDAAAAVRDAGAGLYCYTVNDAALARTLLKIGAHGVFTDHPGRMLAALAAPEGSPEALWCANEAPPA